MTSFIIPHPVKLRSSLRTVLALTTILSGAMGFAALAHADDQTAAAAPAAWGDTLKFYGHVEGGVAFNTASPANNENFGSLFTDKSNQLQMNQLMLTAERPIDSASSKFDIGFKLQGLYGTDARYTHSLAETDHLFHSKYQFDFNEATVNMHLPVAFEGGVDLKIGQFPSPMSAETIDATTNSLYSHSYIMNFGVPMITPAFWRRRMSALFWIYTAALILALMAALPLTATTTIISRVNSASA
jgi:hypothetical protein